MELIHYLVELPTFRTKPQPFVVMDGPSVAKLDASTRFASGNLVTHDARVDITDAIKWYMRSGIGWTCFECYQTTSFNSFIISANNVHCLKCVNSAMEICSYFHSK